MRLKLFADQLTLECGKSARMLERVQADSLDFRPHEKSMVLKSLATHVADLPTWVTLALTTNELDFATMPYNPPTVESAADLLKILEESLQSGLGALAAADDATLNENWTLRSGDVIHSVSTKYEVIQMTISQIIHHRAQLGVYLRLLNIPVPGTYGPSADDPNF
ncbi:MAG: DinB family protein [Candidatus Kapabacteria bacterium]|nr:DinB family protein [Candidatus Kapabacteria bacterium]